MVATKTDEGPSMESPRKRRKVGITIAQKQALIDNLQLESRSSIRVCYVLWGVECALRLTVLT